MHQWTGGAATDRFRRTEWAVFVVFLVTTLARGTGEFRYDALYYWWGAQDVVGTIPAAPDDYWYLRGILTAAVYAPAAALDALAGNNLAGFAVLLQNGAVLAWFAAFLLPRLVSGNAVTSGCYSRHLPSERARWIGAGFVWLVAAGFARYPLVDIYPAVGCFAIVVMLRSRQALVLLFAGVVAGVIVNLRPAYVIVIALLIGVALVRYWRTGLWMVVGSALGSVPQVLFNFVRLGARGVLPPDSASLMALQTGLASYIVRYDTVFASPQPQLFFCSPTMASRIGSTAPSSTGGLAGVFLANLPASAIFALEKIGAALHWPLSTPYTTPMAGVDGLFATAIVAIAVVGCTAVIAFLTLRRQARSAARGDALGLVAIAIGTLLILVSSATESRFALPLVLVGVVGCAQLAALDFARVWNAHRTWAIAALIGTALLVVLGYLGLAHPVPGGGFDLNACVEA